jgi:uncharacterized membrane protein YbhN (UPF0104 family)
VRSIVVSAAAGLLAVAALAAYGDARAVGDELAASDWRWFALALLLTSGNYAVRLVRWNWYLDVLEIRVGRARSASIFFAGLSMAASPGKIGELVKCFLLRRSFEIPIHRSAPAVVAERVTDLAGIALLAAAGATAMRSTTALPFVAVGLVAAGVVFVALRSPAFDRVPRVRDVRVAGRRALELHRTAAMSLVAAVSWFCECLAAYACTRGLNLDVTLPEIMTAFTLATLAGAVTLLPGGIGVTEASMAAFLTLAVGLPAEAAAAATIVIRVATLWFGIALGVVALVVEAALGRREAIPLGSS